MVVRSARYEALVGRDRELVRLAEDLEAAVAGRGGAVAVIGEPGIGKTALVSAITMHARERGARVLWGRCSDVGARTEWEPLAHALSALVDDGTIDAALAARCGAGLLAVVPDASHVAPELAPPAGADPETIAFAATRATTRLLRHLCLQRPYVLVIDDVHDADAASLRLLARLTQDARSMPLLIVMTAREAELGARQREVAELTRDLAIVRIAPLTEEASNELIRRVAPDLEADTVERVLAAGEGNPLYLGELAALLASRATMRGDELPIPVGIKASIQAELARAFGTGGRARRSGAAAERARSAVTRRVREAIAKIAEHDSELGEHLEWAVRTGLTCSYRKIPS
jgi:predicted ATPase